LKLHNSLTLDCDDILAPQDANTPLTEYEIHCRREYPRRLHQALGVRFDQLSQPIAEQLRNEIVDIALQTRASLYTEFQHLRANSESSSVLREPQLGDCNNTQIFDQEAVVISSSRSAAESNTQGPIFPSLYHKSTPIEISAISEPSHALAEWDPTLEPFALYSTPGEESSQVPFSAVNRSSTHQDLAFDYQPVSNDYSALLDASIDLYPLQNENDSYLESGMSWLDGYLPAIEN
jgi:hypothetical protein